MEATLEPGDEALVPYPSFGEYAREVELQERHRGSFATMSCARSGPYRGVCARGDLYPEQSHWGCNRFGRARGVRGPLCGYRHNLARRRGVLGFTDRRSAAELERENIIVTRSLTKLFGLPGLQAPVSPSRAASSGTRSRPPVERGRSGRRPLESVRTACGGTSSFGTRANALPASANGCARRSSNGSRSANRLLHTSSVTWVIGTYRP